MTYRSEIILPHSDTAEAITLFDIAKKIPMEKQVGLRDFIRGVGYGLDMADALRKQAAPRSGQRREGA